MNRLLKSTPPRSFPTGGMMMSFTSELTTAASATPMMKARASARTFALSNHSLNSDNIARNLHALRRRKQSARWVPGARAGERALLSRQAQLHTRAKRVVCTQGRRSRHRLDEDHRAL